MKDTSINVFKKIYKKALDHKVISVVLLVIVGYLFYHYVLNKSVATTTYQYATVKRGDLTSVVSGTGQVISNSQVDLKPKVNASVTAVYVKAGDRVHQGQVLFRLDGTDAYKQVRDAKLSLESAKIALEKLTNPTSLSIMNIKNSIQQQKDAEETQNQKVDTAYKTLLTSGLTAVPDSNYTTETAPTISGSYTLNKEGQINISVSQGGKTGYSFYASGLVNTVGDISTIVTQPLLGTGLYLKWNTTPPQTNWVINIPNKQSTSYSSNYDAWQNAITNRDIANAASERTIASLTQQLADLTPDDNSLDVRSAKLSVEQRQNALDDAQYNLSNYTIVAPFDGVMANVSVDIGSSAVMASANSSAPLGTIVTDKKLAQVTLNETDIVKVHLGQKAKVSFDAIDGLELDGDVVEINTLGTVTSGVVTYKAKIAFATDDVRILPNMSVSVDIISDSKNNVLYVPNQAIKKDDQGYYVEENAPSTSSGFSSNFASSTASTTRSFGTGTSTRRRNTGTGTSASNASSTTAVAVTLKRVPVEIGIQTDTKTEIVSGLVEGESVVTKKTTTTTGTTAAPSVTSLLKPQGTGGARGGF